MSANLTPKPPPEVKPDFNTMAHLSSPFAGTYRCPLRHRWQTRRFADAKAYFPGLAVRTCVHCGLTQLRRKVRTPFGFRIPIWRTYPLTCRHCRGMGFLYDHSGARCECWPCGGRGHLTWRQQLGLPVDHPIAWADEPC